MIARTLLRIAAAVLLAASVTASATPDAVSASYDVSRDGLFVATVQESFEKKGVRYQIVSESTPAGLLAMFIRTRIKIRSSGAVTASGLRPEQFEYGRLDDASQNVSAAFDWGSGQLRMTFDGNGDTAALIPGMQDRLSVMYQFMFLPVTQMREIAFHMTNGKKIESYRYDYSGSETIATPLGSMNTLHFTKRRESGDNGAEVWLAPDHNFFPVKLLIIENDGSKYQQVITRLDIR